MVATRAPASFVFRRRELVGRERELGLLLERVAWAAAGRLSVALLAGEAGIGKTLLLDTLARRAAEQGATVLRGGASADEGMPPYLPFIQALGAYARQAPLDVLRAEVDGAGPVLAAVLPELATRLPDEPGAAYLPADQARLRLFDAVGSLLERIAADRPLVLVFDDLHWADAASLDLVCYVARQHPTARLLLVGAYRAEEAELRPELQRALVELNRLRVLETVAVGPLDRDEVGALARGHLGAPSAPGVTAALAEHSEGNPFFVEELLRGWVETGVLVRGRAAWDLVGAPPTLPSGLVGAVRSRLARLSAETVELLEAAAVVGRSFDVGVVAQVVGRDPEVVEGRLAEARRAHVVEAVDADHCRFVHDKVRECLVDGVASYRRRRLHGLIGLALEERDGSPSELAFHFASSGDRARGAEHALTAADQARDRFAFDEARALFATALDLIGVDDPRRGDALLRLGEAARLAGDEAEAAEAFQAALDWFAARGGRSAAGRAARHLAETWARVEQSALSREAFERAIALLDPDGDADLALALAGLATLLAVSLHEHLSGIDHARRALAVAERLRDARVLAVATRTLGNLLVRVDDLEEGTALLERALELSTACGDTAEAAECCACLTIGHFWAGAINRSREVGQRRLELARLGHDPYQLRHAYTWLAVLDATQGRLDDAALLLDAASERVERLASPEPRAYLQFCRAAMRFFTGDVLAAEADVEPAIKLFRAIGPGALVWYLGLLGLIQAAGGRREEARATFEELDGLTRELARGSLHVVEPLAYLAQLALVLDDDALVDRVRPRLEPLSGRFGDFLFDRLLGEMALRDGDRAKAGRLLGAAEALARREGLVWELGRTLEASARLALATRDRNGRRAAAYHLNEAAVIYEGVGAPGEARRVRVELRRLDRGGVQRAHLPAGLSPREAEVLKLVAAGRTNRQIAADLVLSEKTVENHLGSVYAKTGAENRAAATAFAFRNGLA